jgi:hypothetical protein
MRGLSSLFVLFLGCGGGDGGNQDAGVDAPPSPACLEAETYQNLANIETKIFKTSCVFSGCHNGGNTDAGRMDLREGMAHASIVNVQSEVDAAQPPIVAPGNPAGSYLLLMLGEVAPGEADPPTAAPPASIGLMPQNAGGMLLCSQKRQAIVRWIEAGALDD